MCQKCARTASLQHCSSGSRVCKLSSCMTPRPANPCQFSGWLAYNCSMALDNEQHLLFECGFTSHIRSRPEHSHLLGKCSNIRELMQLAYSSII
jgi:hypothetical protein